jgi:hypothetical protein
VTRITAIITPVLLALVLIAAAVGAFTTSEKQTITALRTRITALETSVAALTTEVTAQGDGLADLVSDDGSLAALNAMILRVSERVNALENPITITGLTAVSGPCTSVSDCYADVSWSVDPPATGQVEWGLTETYGNTTTFEPALLGFHSQRIRNLQPDTEYHFRVISTIPGEPGPEDDLVATATV